MDDATHNPRVRINRLRAFERKKKKKSTVKIIDMVMNYCQN